MRAFLFVLTALVAPAEAVEPMRMCYPGEPNGPEKHCVVDGDTVWLEGQNLRLRAFDTPEPISNRCGTQLEAELAKKASTRLLELLSNNTYAVETFGLDETGKRILATIRIGGRDVGDILIEEGLARPWPDGDRFWCR